MITDIVGGLGAGVGVDLSPDGTIAYVVEWSNGELIRVDVRTGAVETMLTGLSFPQDVIRHWDSARMWVSERTGTIREIFGANESRIIDRSGGAPHQLALSPKADRLYVVCYDSGELRVTDLLSGVTSVLYGGLGHPVGLLVDEAETTAYITEQDTGRLSVIDLFTASIVDTQTGLVSPFFLAWDAPHTGVHLVQRDPSNSMQDLTIAAPFTPSTLTAGLAWRPSGVAPNEDDQLIAISTDQKLQLISPAPIPPIVPPPAPFTVETIRFNNDRTNAIPLDLDATTPVRTPEWVAGIRSHPAAFEMGAPVRAEITLRQGPGFIPGPYKIGAVGTLGGIRRTTMTPVFDPAGISDPITVEFMWPLPRSVQALSISLDWYARHAASPSVPVKVGASWHRIYTVLHRPTAGPWDTRRPWASALDRACTWAAGARDPDAAAAAITRAYNSSGVVSYDTVNGQTMYGWTSFNLTAMLERLAGGVGLGGKVNCTDSANTVSTLANVVGCELWQSRMESQFALNPMIAIGYSIWTIPFGGSFSYHEVAWANGATQFDPVWDGCLHVDADADPVNPPHTPLLATGIVFGDCASLTYRSRLCPPTPLGCTQCQPVPATRQRRPIV